MAGRGRRSDLWLVRRLQSLRATSSPSSARTYMCPRLQWKERKSSLVLKLLLSIEISCSGFRDCGDNVHPWVYISDSLSLWHIWGLKGNEKPKLRNPRVLMLVVRPSAAVSRDGLMESYEGVVVVVMQDRRTPAPGWDPPPWPDPLQARPHTLAGPPFSWPTPLQAKPSNQAKPPWTPPPPGLGPT